MIKIFLILVVAAVVESVGVAILSGGLKELNARSEILPPRPIVRVVIEGATNGKILLGIALEAVFFGALLYMLSIRDVSFVWPLTSLGFIFTALAAHFFLNEKVSPARWAGVLLIAMGAALTSYSEAVKRTPAPPAAAPAHATAASSASVRTQ
jgi:drug/metabolite transporter (DMT)-like permease